MDEWSGFFEDMCVYDHMWFCVVIHVKYYVRIYLIVYACGGCVCKDCMDDPQV